MRKYIPALAILLGVFFGSFSLVQAVSTLATQQGGTGTTTPTGILYGDGTVGLTSIHTVTLGTNCTFTTGTLNCTGGGGGSGTISTSSPLVSGQSVYATGVSTVASVATSTVSSGTGISFSGTPGYLLNGSNLTISNSGVTSIVAGTNISISGGTGAVTINSTASGGGSGTVGTSSKETAGYFPTWTTTNGTPALLAGTSNLFQSGTNIGIGTTTPLSALDVNGNITDYNFSGGATTLIVRNGPTQSPTVLASFQNSAGTQLSSIDSAGAWRGNFQSVSNNVGMSDPGGIFGLGLAFANAAGISWASTGPNDFTGTKDLALSRVSAGVLGVGTGAAGNTGGTLLAAKIGVNNASPSFPLDVAGFINTNQYSGYKQNGNTILYASTTNASLTVGASSATSWLSASSTVLNDIAIGFQALAHTPAGSPTQSVAIGRGALSSLDTGNNDIAIGYLSLTSDNSGIANTGFGTDALFANTSGSYNQAIGYVAMQNNTTGSFNIANGTQSLYNNLTGSDNTAIGYTALQNSVTGNDNVSIGFGASYNNISATSTTMLGEYAGKGTAAYNNQGGTYVGYQSGFDNQTGSDYNTLLGYKAGFDLTTGTHNLILGDDEVTANGVSSGSNNILIGEDVRASLVTTGSNQLNIGNLIFGSGVTTGASASTGNVGIGVLPGRASLEVMGTTTSASGHALTIWNSSAADLFDVGDDGSTTASNGFNITSGCYAVGNICLGSGSGTVGAGTTGQFPYYAANGTTLTATSSIFVATSQNVGIATTTPLATLAVGGSLSVGAGYNNTPQANSLIVQGTVGIGTTSPGRFLGNPATPLTIQVSNAALTNELILENDSNGAARGPAIGFTTQSGGEIAQIGAIPGPNTTSRSIVFNDIGDGAVFNEAMVLQGNFLGLGTTSPMARLDVVGANGGTAPLFQLSSASGLATTTRFIVNNDGSATLNGPLTLTNALTVGNGGTGVASLASGHLLYGSGSTALTDLAPGTAGQVLGIVGGVPAWVATSTSSGYSPVGTTGQFPYFSATNILTATSSLFLATNGNIGIGSTTPWALLSISSPTYNYSNPLLAISTSSDRFGSLLLVQATSTEVQSNFSPLNSLISGVRIIIGEISQYGVTSGLDQLFVNGRINTGDWRYADCEQITSGTVIGDGTGSCPPYYAFQVATAGQSVLGGVSAEGLFYTRMFAGSATAVAAGSGIGLYLNETNSPATPPVTFATTTPVIETVARLENIQNATSTVFHIGWSNMDISAATFNGEPTAGCWFVASSTIADWYVQCRTAAGTANTTSIDTGVASSTTLTGTGSFYRFRIEADNTNARFYIQKPGNNNMQKVATISTNYPSTTGLVFGLWDVQIVAGLPSGMQFGYVRSWLHLPFLNY